MSERLPPLHLLGVNSPGPGSGSRHGAQTGAPQLGKANFPEDVVEQIIEQLAEDSNKYFEFRIIDVCTTVRNLLRAEGYGARDDATDFSEATYERFCKVLGWDWQGGKTTVNGFTWSEWF